MGSFLVFIDGNQNATGREILASCGLSALVSDAGSPVAATEISGNGGPSGNGGMLVLPFSKGASVDPPLLFSPALQTWVRCKPSDAVDYWIGWQNDSKPGPDDLARAVQHEGPRVRFHDGNLWQLPACLLTRQVYGLDDHGRPCRRTEPMSQSLLDLIGPSYELLERHYGTLAQGLASEFDADDHLSVVGELLSKNYHITTTIALALGMITPELVIKSIMHVTDFDRFSMLLKLIQQGNVDG